MRHNVTEESDEDQTCCVQMCVCTANTRIRLRTETLAGAPKYQKKLYVSTQLAFVADTQLCKSEIRTKTPCGVRYVACHVQVALLLSFLGPPVLSGVPIGVLLVVLQRWLLVTSVCRTFSGWLTLVEVFAVVPLGVSCFLSYRVGRYSVAR